MPIHIAYKKILIQTNTYQYEQYIPYRPPTCMPFSVLRILSHRLVLSLPGKPLFEGVSALIFVHLSRIWTIYLFTYKVSALIFVHVCRRRIGPFYKWFSLPSQLMQPPAPEFRGYEMVRCGRCQLW